MSTIRVEYEWTPPRCSSCKVFGHVLGECPKKIVSGVLKNLKTPRQAVRGVQVGSNVGSKVQVKPTKQVYHPISKKNGANSNGTKKQVGLTRQKASTSNPLDAFNTVENDDELGANGWKSKSAFGGPTTASLAERINDLERQILDGKLVLVDDNGKLLKNVDDRVNVDSDSEVDEVFNETAAQLLADIRGNMTDWQNILHVMIDDDSKRSSDELFKRIVEEIKSKLMGMKVNDLKAIRDMEDFLQKSHTTVKFLVSWSSSGATVPINAP
ncbi:zinc knuckle CX2CX4HX4C containing protein [Tanacetum coccineum]